MIHKIVWGRALSAAIALSCVACGAGWSRRSLESLEAVPARQQVQVWRANRASIFHGVRVDSAAVRGIPYQKRLACDSCYVVIPRADVDSVRFGDLSEGLWKSVALAVGVLVGAGIVYCSKGGCAKGT